MYTIEKKSPGQDMRHGWQFVYCDTRLSKVEVHFKKAQALIPPKWHVRMTGPGINKMYYRDDAPPPMIPATPLPTILTNPPSASPPQGSIADAASQDDDDDDYSYYMP